MKTPTPIYRCPLGRLQPETTDLEAIKQRGWRDQHILVVNAFSTNASTSSSANSCSASANVSMGKEALVMADRHAAWTIENVAARFEEAASTGRRLPPVRVQGYFNTWPVIVRKEWSHSLRTRRSFALSLPARKPSTGCSKRCAGAAGGRAAPPRLDAGQALRLARHHHPLRLHRTIAWRRWQRACRWSPTSSMAWSRRRVLARDLACVVGNQRQSAEQSGFCPCNKLIVWAYSDCYGRTRCVTERDGPASTQAKGVLPSQIAMRGARARRLF